MHTPFGRPGFVSYFSSLAFVVARTLVGRGCGRLGRVLLSALVLFLLLLCSLNSCARAQNLGLGGSWLGWVFGVRVNRSAATSRCLGLGRVHLVYAASHRSPSSRLSKEWGKMWSTAQARSCCHRSSSAPGSLSGSALIVFTQRTPNMGVPIQHPLFVRFSLPTPTTKAHIANTKSIVKYIIATPANRPTSSLSAPCPPE